MTITKMTIFNNNNTRMFIFPFFNSGQISHIIESTNYAIKDEMSLPAIITKM